MKSAKKSILKTVAKVGAKSAEIGASSASILGFHQPKEPKALQNLKKFVRLQRNPNAAAHISVPL